MAYWAHVQIEVLGRPLAPRDLALLERALLVYDGDAPVAGNDRRDWNDPWLHAWGYEGAWRKPMLSVTEVLSLIRALGYEARGRAVTSVVYNDYSGTEADDRRRVREAPWVTSWAAPSAELAWVVTRYDRWNERGRRLAHHLLRTEHRRLAAVSRRYARLLPPLPAPPLPYGSRGARRRARARARAHAGR